MNNSIETFEEFVFDGNQSAEQVDWDELDLQLFDGTLINDTTKINHGSNGGNNIEDIFRMPYDHTTANTEDTAWSKADTDTLLSATVAGASSADTIDFNQPLEVWLDNSAVNNETQSFNMSAKRFAKKVHLMGGDQDVALNSTVKGNLVDVTATATGDKNITLGGGDAVLVDMESGGTVNIIGGAGNDSVVVRGATDVVFDMSAGGKDKLITYVDADAHVSLTGYTTDAAIVVEEAGAATIANAIQDGLVTFRDGEVVIENGTTTSRIDIDSAEDGTNNGWFVNLQGTHVEDAEIQLVGFTAADGGTVDGSTYTKPLVLVGNMDGTKAAGSELIGGSGNDTVFAGGGDTINAGSGKDLVILQGSDTRDGAQINISEGRTTIRGMNNALTDFTGDTLAVDGLDISTTKFSLEGGNLTVKGADFYTVIEDVDTSNGYVTQYFRNGDTGTVYRAAIGGDGANMVVAEDGDARAYDYIAKNGIVDFTEYEGDAFIDLKGDWADSYIDGVKSYFEGVTQLVGGEGDMVFKGGDANETLTAGKGNTSMYGAGGHNLLVGYSGSDKEGQTTFFALGINDGSVNTISGFEFVSDSNYIDSANVTADIIDTDLENNTISNVAISGDDVLIEVTKNETGAVEKVLVQGAMTSDGYSQDMIINGVVAQVGQNVVNVDKYATSYTAKGANATVTIGEDVGDTVSVWLNDDGRDMQFEGDFAVIDATNSTALKSELAGNSADNTIYAGANGSASLWGGNGGNDLMVGGAGTDNFFYVLGDGDDTVNNASSGDVVNLANMTLADITIDTITSSAVVFNFSDGGKLTVNDGGATGVTYKVGDDSYVVNSGRTDFEKK